MIERTITVYRAGTFTSETAPPWFPELLAAAEELGDWDKAIHKVLVMQATHTAITDGACHYGRVTAWHTPGGGMYVEMDSGDRGHADLWLPDTADWLPFSSAHVEPFLQTRAAFQQTFATERLANALIAFIRHGEGEHIDRVTGDSRIDQQEDWKNRQPTRASSPPVTPVAQSPAAQTVR